MLDRAKAPSVRPFGHLTLKDETIRILSNGLVLHTLRGGNQEVVKLKLVAEGGSSDCDRQCVAHFAAELLREGNIKNDSDAIADIIDYNGAWLDSRSSGHFTTLQLSGLTSKFDQLAPVLVDCFVAPTFPQNAFEIIRSKGIARQKLNLSKVSFLASADNKRMIAGEDHIESRIPSPHDIESISREDIVRFHNSIVNARHVHVYLSGRFDDDNVDRLCRLLEQIPASDRPSPMTIVPYKPEPAGVSTINKSDSLQSAVVMSIPTIPRSHPDYNFLRMAVTALGGYFGSRLMTNIREDKGYTYGISSSLIGSFEGSYITISAQCDNRYTHALIDEVRAELNHMADTPLTETELSKLKFNLASDLASTLDTPFNMLEQYELTRTVGVPPDYFESRQKSLSQVTSEIISDISRRYMNIEELRTSIAGDVSSF